MRRKISVFSPQLRVAAASLCLFGALSLAPRASATFIIDDTFTAGNNTALIGRMPFPTDTPAVSYNGNGNVSTIGGFTGGSPYEADVQSNAARIGGDAGVAVNLGISTPDQFQLTIDFNISGNSQTQVNDARRGAGLGFFSSVALGSSGTSHGFNNFTGLVVDRTGTVRLIAAGADTGIATTVAAFDPAVTHTLTFVVNTANGVGTISAIQLDATNVTLAAPVDTFTTARSLYAGFYNSSGAASDLANFDNFSVAIVPETPTGPAVSAIALLCIHAIWRERTRRKRIAGA